MNEETSVAELLLAFNKYRETTENQINQLKKEVQELRDNVATNNIEKKKRPKKKKSVYNTHNKKHEKMEAISYADAFDKIGGDEQLAMHVEQSKRLTDKVNNAKLQEELNQLFPRDLKQRSGFSTKLVNQAYVPDLDHLYAKAEEVFEDFSNTLDDLALNNENCRAIIPPIKGKVRARMKGAFKYRNKANNTVAWYRLTDLVRGTLEFLDIASLYKGLESTIQFFGDNVREMNDRYQDPMTGGYRDIQLVINFQGHMCEVQLNTALMMQAKKTTGHRNYQVYRELKAAVKQGDIDRVLESFDFAKQTAGEAMDNGGTLKELLSGEARMLLHVAAKRGYARIIHAFLLHGADANSQDKNGDTPLHIATFHGHENCVWVLVHEGKVDYDIKDNLGRTALVKGYMMLWQRPPEAEVRAVSTLAQTAGLDRMKEAQAEANVAIQNQLHQSRVLVDHAADGNIPKMLEELREWADPVSKDRDGKSAIRMAIVNNHRKAVDVLLDYKVTLDTDDLCSAIETNRVKLWKLLLDSCDISTFDEEKLVAAAHNAGLDKVKQWLERLHKVGVHLERFRLQEYPNGIFVIQNAWLGKADYVSFRTTEKDLRATYGLGDAMPVAMIPTDKSDIYKLFNMWPGENKWISFSGDENKWLFARYDNESDAMPIKFVPTGKPNIYKMLNMWGGEENKWISFTDDGTWLRATYDEGDAMPVRLHFRS
jgi:hypothetical protein